MWGKGHSNENIAQNRSSQVISIEIFLSTDLGLEISTEPSNSKHQLSWDAKDYKILSFAKGLKKPKYACMRFYNDCN